MKAILEFNLPEDNSEHKRAVKSTDAFLALWDIAQEVFRPARKHGYSGQPRLNELLSCDGPERTFTAEEASNQVSEAISILETMFYEIINERGVNPSDNLE